MSESDPPRGREDVQQALILAATKLFSAHGPTAVSVRQIAKEAGVNHGLVHRHFGSKDQLLRAVLNRLAAEVSRAVGPGEADESLYDLIRPLMHSTEGGDGHWLRIIARSILDGHNVEDLQDHFPMTDRVIAAARREQKGPLDPEARVSFIMSVGLGMLLFEPFLRIATGQDEAQWERTRAQILGLAMQPKSNP